MGTRKLRRWIVETLQEMGATDVAIVDGGRHPRAEFQVNGHARRVVFPCSPSDCAHGQRNLLAQIRRTIAAQ